MKILEISDTLEGYTPRDLEKYRSSPNQALFVEDVYLEQSEYLRNCLYDHLSGPVAVISDNYDILSELRPNVKLFLRPLSRSDLEKLLIQNDPFLVSSTQKVCSFVFNV